MSERVDADRVAPRRGLDLALAALVWLGALLVLFWPLARGVLIGAPHFFDWDVPEQYWPDLVRLCRELHQGGGVPYWSPLDRGGYASYADPQAAPYLPLNWAICAVAGPDPALGWASARVVIGFLVAMLGAQLWLVFTDLGERAPRARHPWSASALGAVVFASAPFFRHNLELNLTLGLAFLPWVLLAIDALVRAPSPRRGAALALAVALVVWAGSPPAFFLSLSFALGYLALRLAARARSSSRGERRDLALALLVAGALALMLTLVVLAPTSALSHRSVQADHTFGSIAEGALGPSELWALLAPRPGNHLYLGPVVGLLTLAALAARRTRAVATACVLASALAVLLALGDHTPVFRLAFEALPGFDRFRLPHRYEAWLGPCAALSSALGLEAIVERVARARALLPDRRRGLGWGAAIPLVALHLALVTSQLDPERHTRAEPSPCRDASDAFAALARREDARVFDEFAVGCRSGTRLVYRDLRGYQDPLMLHSYERVLAALEAHPRLLSQLGVRYALTSPHFLHGWDHHYLPRPEALLRLPGAREALRDGERVAVDLGAPVPRAYVVPRDAILHVARREDALERLSELAPRPIAIVEDGAPDASRAGSVDGVAVATRIEDPSFDHVVVHLAGAPAGLLVLSDTFDVGWSAEVDGAPATVERVNALVRGVRVPAGARRVELRFAPLDGRLTRALWGLGWLLALLLLAAPDRRRDA